MRESIGTTFMLNFILLFIFLVFAFLGGTLSYYKAYRVNNNIVHAIERFEGYNELSYQEIARTLGSLGYDLSTNIGCPDTYTNSSRNFLAGEGEEFAAYNPVGVRATVNPGEFLEEGFCVYLFYNDNGAQSFGSSSEVQETDIYYSYGVLTYMYMRLPAVGYVIRVPIFSRTNRMFDFEASRAMR